MGLGAVWGRVKNVCQQNGLLILSVLAVVIGCLLGFFLRSKHLSIQVSSHRPLSPHPTQPKAEALLVCQPSVTLSPFSSLVELTLSTLVWYKKSELA